MVPEELPKWAEETQIEMMCVPLSLSSHCRKHVLLLQSSKKTQLSVSLGSNGCKMAPTML